MTSEDAETPFLEEAVPPALDGERVDRVVAMVTNSSRSEALAAIVAGQVLVNGRLLKPSHRLAQDDVLTIARSPIAVPEPIRPDPSVTFEVVYEDADVIVIDKPAGLVMHPGAGRTGSTLVHGLLARFPELGDVGEQFRPGLVHRLDRGTSGLLVVARNPMSYADLVDQLGSHSVERVYTTLTWRHFENPRGVVDAPIGRSRRDPLRMTVAVDGRPSRTHYEVDNEFTEPLEMSLVSCRLETGRTHQIRVHLSSIGHAVVGDSTYGGARKNFPMTRPFLHARRLSFSHPGTGELVTLDSPLPAELSQVLDRLS